MAIKDTSKKPYLVDNNDNVKVGISLPFTLSRNGSGVVESTSTTLPKSTPKQCQSNTTNKI